MGSGVVIYKMTRVTTRVTTTTPTVSQATIDGYQLGYRLFIARKQLAVLSDFSGYIDEFRVMAETIGLADFTPPTVPFTY